MKRIWKTLFLCLFCIIIFNILAISATIILHEGSHFFAGIYFGCEEIKIVLIDFPNLNTYSELKCSAQAPIFFLALAPLVLVTPFGLSFLLLRKLPEKHLSWIIIGFNFIISMSDLRFASLIGYLILAIGIILVIYGQILFINQFILLFMKIKIK